MELRILLTYFILFASLFYLVFFFLLFLKYKREFDSPPSPDYSYTPLISIIIPAYNEEKYLSATLNSVLSVNYPKDKLEVIVVDDGSSDKTYEVAKSFEKKGVRVLRQKNKGKAAALNLGLSKAKGEFVITMDVDSFVEDKDIIYKLLAYFDSPKVAAVTPTIVVKETGTLLNEMQKFEYLFIVFTRRLMSFINTVQVTPGPFSIFRADVLKKVGGFDEKNIVEDNEIALRLQKYGYEIRSALNAKISTIVPKTFRSLVKQRIRWHRGGLRNALKYVDIMKPSYGDLGIFMLPLNIFYFVLLFMALFVLIDNVFFGHNYFGLLGFDALLLGFGAVGIIGIIAFFMSVLFLFMVIDYFKLKKVNLLHMFIYFFFYWYLMAIYNLAVVWKEIKREPLRW